MKENVQILQRGHIKMLINILYFCVSLQIAPGSLKNKLGVLKNANRTECVCRLRRTNMKKGRLGHMVGERYQILY